MTKTQLNDIAIRAAKTFIQTFAAVVLTKGDLSTANLGELLAIGQSAAIAGIAAVLSLAMNITNAARTNN